MNKTDGHTEAVAAWLQKYSLKPDGYYLVVGRFVPENNYETIIREHMLSGTKRKLMIIATPNKQYLMRLEKELHFREDIRISFSEAIYEQKVLQGIRKNAFAYLHGHEVGGTNPSLLESMGCVKLNLLLDVDFNREVAEDTAFYWSKEKGSLSRLMAGVEELTEEERTEIGKRATDRIKRFYPWKKICDSYEDLFTKIKER